MKASDFVSAVATADLGKAYFTDRSFGLRTEMATSVLSKEDLILLHIGPCMVYFNRMIAYDSSYHVDLFNGENIVCTLECDNIVLEPAEEESE